MDQNYSEDQRFWWESGQGTSELCHYQFYSKQFNMIHGKLLLPKKSCTRSNMPNAQGRVWSPWTTSLSFSLCPSPCGLDLATWAGLTAPRGSIQNESADSSCMCGPWTLPLDFSHPAAQVTPGLSPDILASSPFSRAQGGSLSMSTCLSLLRL